jgi:hypothetical protein
MSGCSRERRRGWKGALERVLQCARGRKDWVYDEERSPGLLPARTGINRELVVGLKVRGVRIMGRKFC